MRKGEWPHQHGAECSGVRKHALGGSQDSSGPVCWFLKEMLSFSFFSFFSPGACVCVRVCTLPCVSLVHVREAMECIQGIFST